MNYISVKSVLVIMLLLPLLFAGCGEAIVDSKSHEPQKCCPTSVEVASQAPLHGSPMVVPARWLAVLSRRNRFWCYEARLRRSGRISLRRALSFCLRALWRSAMNGNIRAQIPEWDNQWVQIKLEQSAVFDGDQVLYLAGRQTEWHVVK